MKILVIHATAGAGHKKAAEAIYKGLKARGDAEAYLVDALDYTNPFFKHTYPWFYGFLVTRVPAVWGFFFGLLDYPFLQPIVKCVRRIYNGFNAQGLEKHIITAQYDVIITTQFLSAEVTAYLKRTGKIKSKIICVVTDFDVHRIWINEGIDYYTGACPYTVDKLKALGVPPNRAILTGIPTDAKFSKDVDRAALRVKLGLEEGQMTILIATGSFGMGPIEELMRLLSKYQLLIVCGHNAKLYELLKARATFRTHVLGLVDNMDELMSVASLMVTKPGGLSIAEALVKNLPMLFFSAIPGQEKNNVKVLTSYGVSAGESSLDQIVDIINKWDTNPKELELACARLSALARPNAVVDILSLI